MIDPKFNHFEVRWTWELGFVAKRFKPWGRHGDVLISFFPAKQSLRGNNRQIGKIRKLECVGGRA